MQGGTDIRKRGRIKSFHPDASVAPFLQKLRSAAGGFSVVAECVVEQAHFHAVSGTLGQSFEHDIADAVVPEFVVFHVNVLLRLSDVAHEVVELVPSVAHDVYAVRTVTGKSRSVEAGENAVGGLTIRRKRNCQPHQEDASLHRLQVRRESYGGASGSRSPPLWLRRSP